MPKRSTTHPAKIEKLTRSSMAAVRSKVAMSAGTVLGRIEKLAKGEIEMTALQLKASEILLKKCLPDLANETVVEQETDLGKLSREELSGMINAISSSNPNIAKMLGLPVLVNGDMAKDDISLSSVIDKDQLNVINAKGEPVGYEKIKDNEADYSTDK